jgi:hypothetical protein
MIWEGARQVVVQTGNTERFNASAPAFLDISGREVEEFRRATGEAHGAKPADAVVNP